MSRPRSPRTEEQAEAMRRALRRLRQAPRPRLPLGAAIVRAFTESA